MTSAKRSNNARSGARSNGSPGAADLRSVVARGAAACDVLRIPHGAAAIVVACSGGPDSAAALHVLRLARPSARLFACYVDHGIRSAASIARDRRAVREQAQAAKAQPVFLRLRRPPPKGVSIEAALRAQRYRMLAKFAASVGARCVLTGHQRDDVAETTLMALARGSGVDGIAAMRPRRPIGAGVDLVRPLLWAPKLVLAAYARSAGLEVSHDETNDDQGYRRNAIRSLLADLESAVKGSNRAIARSAAIVGEDKALLDAVTAAAWTHCVAGEGDALSAKELRKLPAPLLRRVLRFEVGRATGSLRDFTYEHCAAIARAIAQRRGGTHHAGRARVVLSAGKLTVEKEPAVRAAAAPAAIVVPRTWTSIAWNGGRIRLRVAPERSRSRRGSVLLDAARFARGDILTVRLPAPGDRFVPSGRHSEVSLARFLAKEGLTRDQRGIVPLLCRNGSIVAVLGTRADASFIARPGGPLLEATWTVPKAPRPHESRR